MQTYMSDADQDVWRSGIDQRETIQSSPKIDSLPLDEELKQEHAGGARYAVCRTDAGGAAKHGTMRSILLGQGCGERGGRADSQSAFATHFHLIGGTGKGKTTALHTMLQPLMNNPFEKPCVIIIDRLGNFSQELLLWMSSRFCTDAVRKRLVYIQAAREDVVATFNPLLYDTSAHRYYKVERTTEIILRAWESVNIEAMPRLARWTSNAFSAASQLGLTIPTARTS
jgi:hypothetical protein